MTRGPSEPGPEDRTKRRMDELGRGGDVIALKIDTSRRRRARARNTPRRLRQLHHGHTRDNASTTHAEPHVGYTVDIPNPTRDKGRSRVAESSPTTGSYARRHRVSPTGALATGVATADGRLFGTAGPSDVCQWDRRYGRCSGRFFDVKFPLAAGGQRPYRPKANGWRQSESHCRVS
jgi:hypothetical protein